MVVLWLLTAVFVRELIGDQWRPREIGDRGILDAHINNPWRACSKFYDRPEADPVTSHQVEVLSRVLWFDWLDLFL
jgi:hypothetical protein